MLLFAHVVIPLAFFARVTAAAGPAQPITSYEPKDTMLRLRGGAGPLDAVDTAKAASTIALVSGTLHSISASKLLEAYGCPQTPVFEHCLRTIGASVLGVVIPSWCLLNGKCSSTNTAVGLSILPWMISLLKTCC